MIQISNINKSFKKKRVLKTFHLILKRYLYRINRKNGAGKSTLIDILIGNVNANSGEIFDKDKLLQSENRSIMFQKRCFQIN